jgi:hypothetical protein
LNRSVFMEMIKNPGHTVRLFLICCMYGFPRGFILCIVLAGVFRKAEIHSFDHVGWVDALSVVTFPFLVWKGRYLIRRGWY